MSDWSWLGDVIGREIDRVRVLEEQGEAREGDRLVLATLLAAAAQEHVAERVDALIGLAFDEGRALNVSATTRPQEGFGSSGSGRGSSW